MVVVLCEGCAVLKGCRGSQSSEIDAVAKLFQGCDCVGGGECWPDRS